MKLKGFVFYRETPGLSMGSCIMIGKLEYNYLDEEHPWKGILSATAFAVRSTFHTTLRSTAGQLVFGRYMIFNINMKQIGNS
jgi:hypothetical protein